jgi:hypothetical protein
MPPTNAVANTVKPDLDAVRPRTIRAVSDATWDKITQAAQREGLSVGQWLERRVAEWEGDGSPVPVNGVANSVKPADLAALITAAAAMATATRLPQPVRQLIAGWASQLSADCARATPEPRLEAPVPRLAAPVAAEV